MKNRFKFRIVLCVFLAVAMVSAAMLACDSGSSSGGTTTACSSIKLRTIPTDPSVRGPWPVGSRTVTVSGLVTEVWYPATPGSEAGKTKDWIDTREYMPESDPVATDPKFQIDSYDGLPIDTAYGPYPVIVYVHGTGSFRTASHALFTHWASRGFVVLCADNPGIMLGDLIEGGCGALLSADQKGDTRKLLSAVRNPTGSLAFLAGRLASGRIGLGGHSAGGAAITGLGSEQGVQVIIPMASGGVDSGSVVASALIMGGLEDQAATPSIVRSGYEDTPIKKRLVLIPDAGHMAFCSVCPIIMESDEELGSLASIANDGCGPQYMNPVLSTEIVNFASTAVYEETLVCSSTAAGQISTIANRYSGVEYQYDANPSSSSSGGCN
jgi:hypothetical protein